MTRGLPSVRRLAITTALASLTFVLGITGERPPTVNAASYVVNTLADTGPGSLRQAILDANSAAGADTISFSVSGTIVLAAALPDITDAAGLTIDGSGQTVTVSGGGVLRPLSVAPGGALDLRHLVITQGGRSSGAPGNGSAIANAGVLSLTGVTVSDSTATLGGGILNTGTLTVTESTIRGNSAVTGGGLNNGSGATAMIIRSTVSGNSGAAQGGGVTNGAGASLTLVNSTLAGNTSLLTGGGASSAGSMTLLNSTMSANTATTGGGVYGSGAASISASNSIVAGNTGTSSAPDCGGVGLTTVGTNLVSDLGGCFLTGPTPIIGAPLLAALGDNGGPTHTMALLAGSPALDAADDAVCAAAPVSGKDQRGASRPQGDHCDLGAFESSLSGAPFLLSVSDSAVVEGDAGVANIVFAVSLDRPVGGAGVTFDIATANGTAQAGSDYVAQALTGQVIPVGATSYTFTVLVNGDTVFEPDETILVNVSNVVGATVADGQGVGAIVNDDLPPILISVNDVTLLEENGGTTIFAFTVSLNRSAEAGGVTFNIATANGTAQAPSDYVAKTLFGQVIPAGDTSYTFDVSVNGDLTAEDDETFFVNISNVVGATIGTGQGVGVILNDDSGEGLRLTVADVSAAEGDVGAKAFTFSVLLVGGVAPAGGVTFDIATADGTAQAGSDYVAKSLTGQTIPAGGTSYTFEVTVNGDLTFEANETFLVNVSNVVGVPVGDGQAVGTILDDDSRVLSIGNAVGKEGDTGSKVFVFTVSLDAPAKPAGVSFDIATANGTATAGIDYLSKALSGQAIPAGGISYTFEVTVNGDLTPEENETFFVNLSNPVAASIADGQGQGTILDDDSLRLAVGNVTAPEGDAGTKSLVFTVSLTGAAKTGGVTFDIATADGTAQAGSDYVAKTLTGQAIPAGAQSYTFEVVVNGDLVAEANEYFFVTVSNVVGATVSTGQGVGTLQDDDTRILTISSASSKEGDSGTKAVSVNVNLDQPAKAGGVTFDITTLDVTAQAGSDYVARALTAQTIPAAAASYAFEVTINGDVIPEANETLLVQVSNITGATAGVASAAVTIEDDDTVGGRNLRVSVYNSGTHLRLNWDGGNKQEGYTLFRYNTASSTMTTVPLYPYYTEYYDSSVPPGTLHCYVLVPIAQGEVAGVSDLLCGLLGQRSGTLIPSQFTLGLSQSTTAGLNWTPYSPAFPTSAYAVYSTPLDGSSPTIVQFPGSTLSTTQSVPGAGACFGLGAYTGIPGGILSSNTDVVCGIPGFATLDKRQAGSQPLAASDVGRRMKEKLAPLTGKKPGAR